MTKEKRYSFKVTVKWEQSVYAMSKKLAVVKLKETFLQDYNLAIGDNEIADLK